MRKGFVFVVILLSIFLLSGCNKKEQNVVNILNWSSYLPDSVIRDFERELGIKVNYGTYSSNEELLAKLSSARQGTYDLIFPSDYMLELMISKKMVQKLDKYKIKNIDNIKDYFLNLKYDLDNNYSLPFLAASTVIAYNTENIKENITSYNDLLNPKYNNNIVLLDDQRIVIGMALQSLGYDMNETDIGKLREAKEWLLKLKKNIKAFDSDSPKTFLISGEVDIAILWNAEAAIAMQENNKIKVAFPDDGFSVSIDNFAIPVGAKNLDNVYKFIDYILRPEVMKQVIEDYPYVNVNKKTSVLLSDEYLANSASNISDDLFKKGSFVNNIGKYITRYDKLWAEIK